MKDFDPWRLFATALAVLTMFAGYLAWEATHKYAGAVRANRALSQEYADGDAEVDMILDTETGDLWIRINKNNENIHHYSQVCPPQKAL